MSLLFLVRFTLCFRHGFDEMFRLIEITSVGKVKSNIPSLLVGRYAVGQVVITETVELVETEAQVTVAKALNRLVFHSRSVALWTRVVLMLHVLYKMMDRKRPWSSKVWPGFLQFPRPPDL